MLEFTFKTKAIKAMIEEAGESDLVVVKLDFSRGEGSKFLASVTARCEGSGSPKPGAKTLGGEEVDGCPRPPGCE